MFSWIVLNFVLLLSLPCLLTQDITSTLTTTSPIVRENPSTATESSVMDLSPIKDTTNGPPIPAPLSESSSTSSTTPPSTTIAIQKDQAAETTTSTVTPTVTQGDLKDLPLWELIYPDQNSTFADDMTKSFNDLSLPQSSKAVDGQDYTNVSRYFKIDDVTNCEKFFGECLRQVMTSVLPKLRYGDPAIHLPAIDPFYLNRTSFLYNGGPLNGHITVGYVFVYGLTSMKYRKVLYKSGTGSSFKLRLSSIIPRLMARGSYKADLKLNSVNVRPKGEFNISLYNVAIEQLATGEIYDRDGHKFLKLITMNATAALRDAKLNATGLIPDSRLNEIILNVTNQYWREIFNILLPETRENWMPVIRNAVNGVLAMVPFDFLKKI